MELLTGAYSITTINAVYQVHVLGYAYRYCGVKVQPLLNQTISVSLVLFSQYIEGTPYSVYKEGGYMAYIWYYTQSIITGSITGWKYQPSHSLQTSQPLYANVKVEEFHCTGRHTYLHIAHGLLPYNMLKQVDGGRLYCNLTSPLHVSINHHKFTSILLKMTIGEMPLILIVKLLNTSDFVETFRSEPREDRAYIAHDNHHLSRYTMKTYRPGYNQVATLKVNYFKYNGQMSNILPYLVGSLNELHELSGFIIEIPSGEKTLTSSLYTFIYIYI